VLTEKQLRRGIHRRTRDLEAAIDRYLAVYNEPPKPFVWTKTADEILASVARFCHRISDSGHSRFRQSTAIKLSGRVNELTDGTVCMVDSATEADIGPSPKSWFNQGGNRVTRGTP